MQLNITTDYAIRVVLYLGECQEKVSSTQIAQDKCIPKGYLEKVLSALKKASYISADLGTKGGYYLTKGLEDITLGGLLKVMENTVKINRCLESDGYCSRGAQKTCKIRKYYEKIQTEMKERLLNSSLKDILGNDVDGEVEVQ